jgi:exodeoxyribonuclease VII large subunit
MSNLTVTQLATNINNILKNNYKNTITIEGEISNFKIDGKNNLYCNLKDENASINIISWGFKNNDNIQNGQKVVIHGKINTYPKTSTYNIICYKIEKIGIGILHQEYELLKKYINENGLMERKRKRKIPDIINQVGIITAPGGAAIQDILFVLNKNKFMGKVFIKKCFVQGNECPKSVIESIKYFNNLDNKMDVLLITRGGGSFEDLYGYSNKKLLEAIYNSNIPTISAIGHEIDFMLSDFVADLRAPTPSIAAEILSKNNYNILINEYKQKMDNKKLEISNNINILKNRLNLIKNKNINPKILIQEKINKINNMKNILHNRVNILKDNYNSKINILRTNLENYNIENKLDKGYCVALKLNKLCDINKLKENNKLKIIMNGGYIKVEVLSINKNK